MLKKLKSISILPAAWAASLILRVAPSWSIVMAAGMVHFQSGDDWFHVRTVHNLLAHFPHRSGFDPYALYPGGQNIPTGPLWDWLLAWTAWLLSMGSPSPLFIDRVAAWVPAIVGSLFVFPAYFLARRFWGNSAAIFAALWMAVAPGAFLWLTHLGLADHHAAEGFFAFLSLAFLCTALDTQPPLRARFAVLAGLALGAFLATRPAGIFVPAIFACVVALVPLAAAPVGIAVVTAALVFIPVTGNLWSDYTWLSLGGAAAVAAASLGISALFRRCAWPRRAMPLAMGGAAIAGLCALALVRPGVVASLTFEIRRVAGAEPSSRIVSTVQEMAPIYRAAGVSGWVSIVLLLGAIWIPALPMLIRAIWLALHGKRPALALFVIWGAVMTVGTVMQARMLIYFVPVAAVLAGAAFARLVSLRRPVLRHAAWVLLTLLTLGINLPAAIRLMHEDHSPGPDWTEALQWLRQNSPEPFGDASVWSRYYPRRGSSGAPVPSATWGVAVWWDEAYAVEAIARRVPMSNGTQAGAEEMARFYTDTSPDTAVEWLRQTGGRYVLLGPTYPLFAGDNQSRFPVALWTIGRTLDEYLRVLRKPLGNKLEPVPVYLAPYYRTMVARLYLADGRAVAGTGPWVFSVEGNGIVTWRQHFDSEESADEYVNAHPLESLVVGCLDPAASCFALEAVAGVRRAFSSDPLPISPVRTVRAVKVFEVLRP